MFKKITCIVMVFTLLLSISASATTTFTDIDGTEWFYDDLMYLADRGIINGKSDGSFSGSDLLTKDALIKTLVVSQGYTPGNADGYWAQNYIDQASSLGWLNGVEEGKYRDPITRYETCLLIVNALGSSQEYPSNLSDYTMYIADYNQIPTKYQQVVLKVYALGIITGYTDGTFKGNNTLIRSEMTAIISRFNNPNNRKIGLDPSEIATVEAFALDPDNKVVDQDNMKYEDNKLMYKGYLSDTYLPITSTGLQPNIGRIAEDTYIAVASYVHNNTDLSMVTKYGFSNFFMYVNETADIYYSLSIDDASNVITIDLLDIYYEPVGELSSTIAYIHLEALKTISPDHYQDIYNFAKDLYQLNQDFTPIVNLTTFGNIDVKTVAQQGSFRIELTIN